MNEQELTAVIQEFINTLPDVTFVGPYGSKVFKQEGYTEKIKSQIDIILGVDDISEFITKNLQLNPSHFSFFSKMYFKNASIKSLEKGAEICYIPYIEYKGYQFKLGIIETKKLNKQLYYWKPFYLAGRTQKDFCILKSTEETNQAIVSNRNNAAKVGLLLTDKNTELFDYYARIYSLSYLGDTRGIVENPHKVTNIVSQSLEFLDKTYGNVPWLYTSNNKIVDIDYSDLLNNLNNLPPSLYAYIIKNTTDINDLNMLRTSIRKYFCDVNKSNSFDQTVKGIYTAGPVKSIRYVKDKVVKRFKVKPNKK